MKKSIENIIKAKLTEHIFETEAVQEAIEKAREKVKDNKDLVEAQNLMILKDKMMFHKACAMVLQDVLDEHNKEKP